MKNRELVSFDGAALLWMNGILLIPVIFGVMFLSDLLRVLALSVTIAVLVTYGVLYVWAKGHPQSAGAHVLDVLHIGPKRSVRV